MLDLVQSQPSAGSPHEDGATASNDPATLSQKALQLARQHDTPPVPKVYEVWYAYAAGKPEMLCHEIRKIISARGRIDYYELQQLHGKFLQKDPEYLREQEVAGYQFDREMMRAISLVQNHIGSSNRFAGALKNSTQAMTPATPDRIGKVVEGLLAENGRMRAESAKLSHSLTQTRMEVRKLSEKLERSRQNELRDPLTNVGNRRHLDKILPRQISESRESGTPLSLVLADLDHFKRINDTFGHPVGDDVLRFVASLLKDNLKGRDFVARYGGEEFAVILRETDLTSAKAVIKNIMRRLDEAEFVLSSTKTPIGRLTCSFGIALMRPDDTPESLIKRADRFLYKAKEGGRNRFVGDV